MVKPSLQNSEIGPGLEKNLSAWLSKPLFQLRTPCILDAVTLFSLAATHAAHCDCPLASNSSFHESAMLICKSSKMMKSTSDSFVVFGEQ